MLTNPVLLPALEQQRWALTSSSPSNPPIPFLLDPYPLQVSMVFDPESAVHLKPWLVRTLEPICDAEPGALADYILALLKHNVPEHEMRQELAVQLDEFLEKECSSFVETLFTVIRTKSYLPYNAVSASPSYDTKPLDNGIPIPLDALLTPTLHSPDQTRKRSSTDDERDGRPPAKTPRLNNDSQFSRYGHGGDVRMGPQSSGNWNRPSLREGGMGMAPYGNQMGGMAMNGMGPMNGRRPQGYQPPDPKRGICRDYHNNGYCARGAMCKYSHGDDAVVPGQLYPGNGMPFMPMFPGATNGMPFMQGAAYDPNESRMDMRPMGGARRDQRAPLLPRVQQEDGSRVIHPINASGELPVIQDLTPSIPPDIPPVDVTGQGDVDMQSSNLQGPHTNVPQTAGGYNPIMGNMNGSIYQQGRSSMEVDNNAHMPGMRPPTLGRGQFRGGRGGGGRGRGTFGGEVHNFRPEKRNDKTLVVEKIPEEKLSLENVNSWFKRFGTVTNVAIDPLNAKALVSFSNHEEAHAAWKSEDAVFGNRFVKVFWHRPMEGHGQAGARMLAASAPLVANISGSLAPSTTRPHPTSETPSTQPLATSSNSTSTSIARKPSATPASAAVTALAAKQQLLEQKIAEQKSLMASLETASSSEKKVIMTRLRKLGDEMTQLTSTPTPTASTSSQPAAKKPAADGLTDHERTERERLDKELELHNGTDEQAEETTVDLKAKLARLKAEAASLGLDSALGSSTPPYRGGYRGRARGAPRGAGYSRGGYMRGGPPRASMKLDNRPKTLLVKGVGEDKSQALRDWYETIGQLDSIEPTESGTYVVSFKSRAAAEMGLAKGVNIPIVGSVQIGWYSGKEANGITPKHSMISPIVETNGSHAPSIAADSTPARSPDIHHSHLQEEEIVASGWGGDDDEDGMGLL